MKFSRKRFYIFSTIFLILIILLCTTETVMSRNKADAAGEKRYLASLEKEYESCMKLLLKEKGYQNSGVTVRWISDEEGNRSYTVMIHHRRLGRISDAERKELVDELSEAEFEKEKCTFHYEFIFAGSELEERTCTDI